MALSADACANIEETDTKSEESDKSLKIWKPTEYLSTTALNYSYKALLQRPPYAVVVLNQPIENEETFADLCSGGMASRKISSDAQ